MNNIHKNIEEYNPSKTRKFLIAFDYMIADMHNNENLKKKTNSFSCSYHAITF